MKQKRNKPNIIKGIGVFFGTFLLYHIILSPFFPVSETNTILAPDWYYDVGMIISLLAAVIFTNKHNLLTRASQVVKNNAAPYTNPEQKEVTSDMPQNNWNWDDLGRNIQNTIDQAVNSQNYQKLNESIRQAVDAGNNAVRQAMNSSSALHNAGPQAVKKFYGKTLGKTIKSFLQIYIGFSLAITGYLCVIVAITDPVELAASLGTFLIMLTILAVGIWLICSGFKSRAMLKRFKVYKQLLGKKTYCSVKMLASSTGKSEVFVRKELLTMIQKGFFLEGHLDKEQDTLITSHTTYLYYEQSRKQFEAQHQEAAVIEHKAPAPTKDPKVQEVLDRGTAFIAQIRKCNDDIPGEKISEKISHIELLVQKIFQRAEAHPEIVPDLKKLMDYYLPMTVKLLNAYADMDAQPIQGETILNSKGEIEATLDTLTLAFEKLLDDLFADTAMDVSSDISVLNTLLAQEGLTEDEFSNLKPQQ